LDGYFQKTRPVETNKALAIKTPGGASGMLIRRRCLKMQAWESIQETLTWIEGHLPDRVEITELAALAHLSPFYYQRLFSRLVGKPVMEYTKLRRLARAADRLAKEQKRILDLALEYGFENHETFTRAFKEAYGLTPEEYRAKPRPLSHFLMPDLSMMYRLVDENVPLAAQGIILEVRRAAVVSPRCFAGFSIQNPSNDTPGIDRLGELWARFHAAKRGIPGLMLGGQELGVSYAGATEGYFTYFTGAEVCDEKTREGFDSWMLSAGEYAVCAFEAENFYLLTTDALNKARDYMLFTWLPHHGITIDPFMAELYDRTDPDATEMELWFKIKGE
jgi:AraC family transcriptional regulator